MGHLIGQQQTFEKSLTANPPEDLGSIPSQGIVTR
jgi:hypothetical protein